MKKNISFCLLLLSIILVPTKIIGKNLEKSYTNNEGVLISSSVKENLEIMGLSNYEINNLNQEQYNEFTKMDIKYCIKLSQYVESIYEEDELGIITNVDNKYISKKEAQRIY